MGFSTKNKAKHNYFTHAAKLAVLTASLSLTNTVQAGTIDIPDNNPGHLSTLQVKAAVKKLHKGRIIYTKRTSKQGFPNCHIVKMISTEGEFKYIRYACAK